MMAYTTDKAAAALQEARKPKAKRPVEIRLFDRPVFSVGRTEVRLAEARRAAALPLAVR